jgi:endonuclease III-like uncharacterized protein
VAGKTRFEVIVGTILAKNVSWRNAKIAVDKLKKRIARTSLVAVLPDK